MTTQRSSFEKRERDRSKKAKAAAKRDKRLDKSGTDESDAPASSLGAADTAAVLEAVAILHQRFDDNEIEFEEFEELKAELMSRLSVE
jgi:hypothetical protein